MADGSVMFQDFVQLAIQTPNMIGRMLRMCLPVALKPTTVKMEPITGPFKSQPRAAINKVPLSH